MFTSETPDTLLNQLSRKVQAFIDATGLTHKRLARMIGCERSQLTSFLSTGKGLSAERSLRLMQILNSSRAQLEAKFGAKRVSSRILELQESGRQLRFDGSGWVAKEGNGGADPNNSGGDITTVRSNGAAGGDSSGDTITDILREVDLLHKQAREAIAQWFANNDRAKPNAQGSTKPPQTANTNERSRSPGPKPDQFSRR